MSESKPVRIKIIAGAIVALLGLGALMVWFMLPDDPEPVPWHFEFTEVRAFRINWDSEYPRNGILVGDDLNESRQPKDGIILSDQQVEQLARAIMEGKPNDPFGMCHYPHHSLVFYSSDGEIVGHYDICFLCSSAWGNPNGFEIVPDFPLLRELFKSLEVPIANPDWKRQ